MNHKGKKTYATALLAFSTALVGWATGEISLEVSLLLGFNAALAAFLRDGMNTETSKLN
jgi:hypothetical protein